MHLLLSIILLFFSLLLLSSLTHHWLQVFSDVNLLQILELEGLPVLLPHILTLCKAVEVVDEMLEFLVSLVLVERDYGDAVIKLITERVDSIIYYDEILQVSVGDNSEIFYVNSLLCSNAVVAVESVLNELMRRVEQV